MDARCVVCASRPYIYSWASGLLLLIVARTVMSGGARYKIRPPAGPPGGRRPGRPQVSVERMEHTMYNIYIYVCVHLKKYLIILGVYEENVIISLNFISWTAENHKQTKNKYGMKKKWQKRPKKTPFRTAVPLWEQTTQISSNLSPKRDSGSKRVNMNIYIYIYINTTYILYHAIKHVCSPRAMETRSPKNDFHPKMILLGENRPE